MTPKETPATLFGVPLALRRKDADLLLQALEKGWLSQTQGKPGDLGSDLDLLRPLFSPTAREQTLRRQLEDLALAHVDAPFLGAMLAIRTADGMLVTPDGRIMIEVLTSVLKSDTDTVVIDSTLLSWATDQAYSFYRRQSLTRLERVLALRAGTDEPLRYPSVGFVLFLLINRSTDRARALRRPDLEADRRALDEALEGPVQVFADALHGRGRRRTEHFSLYGGYVITEARRRLGEHLSPDPAAIYVLSGHEPAVLSFLARDLKRRSSLQHDQLEGAFDALVTSYRQSHPALAALGLAFERPSVTREVRDQLLRAFDGVQEVNEY